MKKTNLCNTIQKTKNNKKQQKNNKKNKKNRVQFPFFIKKIENDYKLYLKIICKKKERIKMPVQTRAMASKISNSSKTRASKTRASKTMAYKTMAYKTRAYKSSLDDFSTVFSNDFPHISSDFARINNSKTPKLKNPRTDKNNKNKKRKKQQTLDRKVDTDLKGTFQTEIPVEITTEITTETPVETPVETLEQIAQISYLGMVYSLFWDYSKNKAIIDTCDGICDGTCDICDGICDMCDNTCYVEYDDMPIMDIIYRHFGVCNIECDYPGSDEALHNLVSSLPLAQYTILPNFCNL